jgi:hypothetical protein
MWKVTVSFANDNITLTSGDSLYKAKRMRTVVVLVACIVACLCADNYVRVLPGEYGEFSRWCIETSKLYFLQCTSCPLQMDFEYIT